MCVCANLDVQLMLNMATELESKSVSSLDPDFQQHQSEAEQWQTISDKGLNTLPLSDQQHPIS